MIRLRWFITSIFIVCLVSITIYGDTPAKNPLEWLGELENEVVGNTSEGGLIERLNSLEEIMLGRVLDGSVVERLTRLDTLLFVNQPHDVSLLYKTQALEWVLFKRGYSGPIKNRLEKMENLLFNMVYPGPVTKRLEKLLTQVFPEGTIKGKWVTISEGLLVKVRMVNELNSAQSRPGTRFQFEVAESVFTNDFVLFPAGISGSGILEEVNRPANWGRDAKLMLDFAEIKALDGTPVNMFYGSKAQNMDHSRQLAVGASAAGMLAFGPGGILFGFVVKGKEKSIPPGTEFYLQVKEPVRIYTIEK
jgi:hypothetical protein